MIRHDSEACARYGDGYSRFWYRIRGQKVLKVLEPETDDRILEIGCDTGWLTRRLMGYSENVVGIDINDAGLKIANMPNLLRMDVSNMGFRDGSFDKIVCLHTIEHVPEAKKALEEMSRVLKPAGIIVLIYPLEIIRGTSAMGSAWAVSPSISKMGELHIHSLLKAREQHINKLYPGKIDKLVKENGLRPRGSTIFMDPWPSYLTILEKKKQPQEHHSFDTQSSESINGVWIRSKYSKSFA